MLNSICGNTFVWVRKYVTLYVRAFIYNSHLPHTLKVHWVHFTCWSENNKSSAFYYFKNNTWTNYWTCALIKQRVRISIWFGSQLANGNCAQVRSHTEPKLWSFWVPSNEKKMTYKKKNRSSYTRKLSSVCFRSGARAPCPPRKENTFLVVRAGLIILKDIWTQLTAFGTERNNISLSFCCGRCPSDSQPRQWNKWIFEKTHFLESRCHNIWNFQH